MGSVCFVSTSEASWPERIEAVFYVIDGYQIVPPLPPCKFCGRDHPSVVCVVLSNTATEYYSACEHCKQVKLIVVKPMLLVFAKEVQKKWQQYLEA